MRCNAHFEFIGPHVLVHSMVLPTEAVTVELLTSVARTLSGSGVTTGDDGTAAELGLFGCTSQTTSLTVFMFSIQMASTGPSNMIHFLSGRVSVQHSLM